MKNCFKILCVFLFAPFSVHAGSLFSCGNDGLSFGEGSVYETSKTTIDYSGTAYTTVDLSPLADKKADIYTPIAKSSADKFPIVVLVHGGSFIDAEKEREQNTGSSVTIAFDRSSVECIAQRLAEKGYAVINIDYNGVDGYESLVESGVQTLIPPWKVAHMQVLLASSIMQHRALSDSHIDADKVAVIGHSAAVSLALGAAYMQGERTIENTSSEARKKYIIENLYPNGYSITENNYAWLKDFMPKPRFDAAVALAGASADGPTDVLVNLDVTKRLVSSIYFEEITGIDWNELFGIGIGVSSFVPFRAYDIADQMDPVTLYISGNTDIPIVSPDMAALSWRLGAGRVEYRYMPFGDHSSNWHFLTSQWFYVDGVVVFGFALPGFNIAGPGFITKILSF